MNEITIHGNTSRSDSIKLNHSAGGTAVVTFSVAIPDRYFDRQAGQWKDRPPVWQRVVCFGTLAENVHDTFTRDENGGRSLTVTVTGALQDDSWTRESRVEGGEGGEDVVIRQTKLVATEVAVSLRYATAAVTKNSRERATEPAAS